MHTIDLPHFFKELDQLFDQGNGQAILKYLESHYAQAKEWKDCPGQVAIANELGGLYRSQGHLEKAKQLYRETLQAIELYDPQAKDAYATTLINAGDVHLADRDFDRALEDFLRADRLLRETHNERSYQMAALKNNLSACYREMGDLVRAESSLREALSILKQFPEARSEYHTSLINLGQLLTRAGKYQQAKDVLHESLSYYNQEGNQSDPHRPMALAGLGEVAYFQGDYHRALDFFQQAQDLLRTLYGPSPIVQKLEESIQHIRRIQERV